MARAFPWIALALLAAFPLLAPLVGLDYYVNFVRRVLIFALAAASLNFILGFGGLVALGHMGFVGVGAYTLVALADAGQVSAWLLWPAAAVVAGGVAALVGLVALRTRGVYFIMITLAFAQMLYFAAVSLRAYGGDDGYNLMQRPELGLSIDLANEPTFYWVVLVLFAAVMTLMNRATRARFGQALVGIRDNEVRMQAMGYPVFRLKLVAFALAGAVAGLAGALLVTHNNFVSPSVMHWTQSATLIVMVVIGGVGHRWGGPVGAAVWIGLEEIVRRFTDYWHLPLGLLLIAIVFLAPRGLAGLRLPVRRRTATHAATAAMPEGSAT
ncbi:branched-chain amino acid ABC transporter permease [uncultured Pseudacidovorax sp.]|uniref:branched-chain amino acid ABC transporter permease n=1 Tax=uncultured Pseudacidovorax sp. TaxID=679313 RepID=UPI0025E8C073|nr:branched-chain amino acid ABC transporter permease [uncultured Pseudacidovorax sp.]